MEFFDNIKKRKVILASKSARRELLLKALGIDFEICVIDVEENYPDDLQNEEIAEYLAKQKADVFQFEDLDDDTLIITADTIVLKKDKLLTKPKNKQEAIEMLSELSSGMHIVITAVCIKTKHKLKLFHSKSKVYFKSLTQEEIEYYIDKYHPYDKAGSYGIQEWIGYIGIEKIEGSYFNVMGLPTQRLYAELKDMVL